jgi:hypothetical protein
LDPSQLKPIRYAAFILCAMPMTIYDCSGVVRYAVVVAVLALLALPSSGGAQTSGTVRGRVVDDRGVAVPNAEVQLQPGPRRTIASADGQFLLHEVTFGETELRVRRLGYSPVTVRFQLAAADTTVVITMTAIPQLLDSVRVRERARGFLFNLAIVDDAGPPVPMAEVVAPGIARLATDSAGQAVVANPKRGTMMLRVRKIGYRPFFGAFTIAAERVDTIVLARLPQELAGVAVLAESGFGRDTFVFAELDSRMKWKTTRAGIVSREELAPFGDQNICSVLPQTMSARLVGREFWAGCDAPRCVLINGERPYMRPISSFLASEVEAIEYYPFGSDWSGTIFSRAALTCYPGRRGSRGAGNNPGGYVIWLRERRS